MGSAAGGLFFYFLFLPYSSVFTTIWIASGIILFLSWFLFRPWPPLSNTRPGHWMWLAVALLVVSGAVFGSRLDHMSRRWQWGPNLAAVYDTAYHNIALLKKDGQVSVFTNGLWLYSEPDRLSAEQGVHLALLQHPAPKTILLLGGGIGGLLEELFKQPVIRHIDYVEPDPDFIRPLKPHLSSATAASLQHPGVRLFHLDPRAFLRRSQARYDVILMNVGDPITAQMNRFYTKEFFAVAKQRLSPDGIFSFAVSGGESMLGPTQARYLGSIKKTLQQIFPKTLIYPGDQTRFFATDISGVLLSDYAALANRISERNLQLTYIREDILQDALSPFRLDYLKSILEGIPGAAVNRDFFPICYFQNLMMWAVQWHAALQKFLNTLAELNLRWIWGGLAVAGALTTAVFWTGRCKFRVAVAGSIFVSGAVEMVLQLVFLLSFQIVEGFVYRQLTLIIAFFMTGLAGGAGWVSRQNLCAPQPDVVWRFFYSRPGTGLFAPFRADAIFAADSRRDSNFFVAGGNGLAVFNSQLDYRCFGRCSFCLGSPGHGRQRCCYGENRRRILRPGSCRGCRWSSPGSVAHTPDLRNHEYTGFSGHLIRYQPADASPAVLKYSF